jgi:tetraacyldisaccharide-1-P 4'-kinase
VIVVTEKDAVKLVPRRSELPDTRVMTQRLLWESGREEIEMRIGRALGWPVGEGS